MGNTHTRPTYCIYVYTRPNRGIFHKVFLGIFALGLHIWAGIDKLLTRHCRRNAMLWLALLVGVRLALVVTCTLRKIEGTTVSLVEVPLVEVMLCLAI